MWPFRKKVQVPTVVAVAPPPKPSPMQAGLDATDGDDGALIRAWLSPPGCAPLQPNPIQRHGFDQMLTAAMRPPEPLTPPEGTNGGQQ